MWQEFKPFLKILFLFAGIYIALLLSYQWYLNGYIYQDLDPFSYWVADQVIFLQESLGYSSRMIPYPTYEAAAFKIEGKEVSTMVEGCNVMSILILFLAFIFAFYKGKITFLFAISGIVILHFTNVIRITMLNYVLLRHPDFGKITHDYVFPAIIYGLVVVLWLIWVKYFVLRK